MKKRLLSILLPLLVAAGNLRVAAADVVEIATAQDLFDFAQSIQNGEAKDGVLTADIDLSTSDYPDLMIGTESAEFGGVFDGQGHTITYHYESVNNTWRGLFAFVNGATIRNLRVEGSAYVTAIHFGALIGRAYGNVLVENVVTNVDITGARNGVTGDAGMLGANYAHIVFNNCATLGTMGYPGSSMYSSYSGWSNGDSSTTLNNCFSACTITEGTNLDSNSGTLTHGSGTNIFNNCYYLNYFDKEQGTQITEEQITNGSLCYKLNGDQSNILWTQSINNDPFPMPDPTGPRVYGSGTLRCDGTELEDNPLIYSNTESYPVIPDHQYSEDGICSECGQPDPNAVKKDAEGFYLIGNADQLYWLNKRVLESTTEIKARLTDDVDLNAGIDPDLMIGTQSKPFTGIFDGAGHTITYDYALVDQIWRGLFAFVKDATIRNLRVEGSVFATAIHYGALIGRGDGTILVENVVTNVDITGAINGITGDAGMIGANYANITFNNCATHCPLGYAENGEQSSMYSPFSGWSNGGSSTTLNNCYSTCKLKDGTDTGNCFTLTHQSGTVTINNSYYLYEVGKVLTGERIHQSQITEEQITSGELCYLLNGDQSNIAWYQTLGEDEMPEPFNNHLRVYGAGKIFKNITDANDFSAFVDAVIEDEKVTYGETIAQKSLIDAYLEAIEALMDAPTIDAFMTGFAALDEQRQAIQSSADAYAAYIAKVEETKTYLVDHPELNNEKVVLLRNYLTESIEPNDNYLNGSAEYILEYRLLGNAEIKAEIASIDKMLQTAITYTTPVGTDVSLLFNNINLSDRFNGWEGQVPTGWGTSETSPLYAAECLAAKMDMYQTVTGLPNGIYEFQVNGAFRPTPYNDFYNVNYAATLYTNNIHNFFQANIEGMISADEAIDGENCNINGPVADFPIYDEGNNVIGYTMQGIVSCCNAFQAGRYPNSVLCNVTDGTLTIGVRQPGTSLSRDWLGFGGMKVTYYGKLDEAGESLNRVLKSQSDRAKTILNDYLPDYIDNYAAYPNFSQALWDELRVTVNSVADTASISPEKKYELVEKFSQLFLQIYECKQAYITLMDKAEELFNIMSALTDDLSSEEYNLLDDAYTKMTDGYRDGSLTAEEALAFDINGLVSGIPEKVDGYYILRTPKDYYFFTKYVEKGGTKINAKLASDINLCDSEDNEYANIMIGNEANQFAGIFDGQGHTVTCSFDVSADYCGLFSFVNGATIKNLRVEGNALTRGIHFGALIGRANGTILVDKVITDVNIVGVHNGVTGNGGMIGRLEGNITFNDCATLGKMGYPGSSMYCGYVAYAGSGSSTLNNCYTVCELTEGTGIDYCYTFCRGTNKLNNCYYLNKIGKEVQGTSKTLQQFQNGEVCYRLNEGAENVWYQTIGEDHSPVLSPDHYPVLYSEDVDGYYYNLVDDVVVGIEKAKAEQPAYEGIYNLAGQRLQKLQKGINIVNGKKLLVK